jgi:hypothetical protein
MANFFKKQLSQVGVALVATHFGYDEKWVATRATPT